MPKPKETIIKANRAWWDLELSELFNYKDLLYLLIRRNFVTSYKQTILGPLWIVLQALMGSAVFTVVFGNIAGLSTDGHPAFLFYLCGNLSWQYFGCVFGAGSNALQANMDLFSKVYFPRLIPPIGEAVSSLLNFLIQLTVFCLALAIYRSEVPEATTGISTWIFLLPLLVFQSVLLALGMGFLMSSVSVKYRDLGRFAALFTQFLLYVSPIIYPISEIPSKYQNFMAANPLTFIIESYRFLLLGHSQGCTLEFAIPSLSMTILVFFLGLVIYNKTQRTYVDFI